MYFNRLLGYLLVLTGDEEVAREALQMTLVRVARYAKKFDSEQVFWSWLTVLARSSVVDESRRSRRYLSFLSRFFEHKQIETTPPSTRDDDHLLEVVESNMAALPPEERELIERKYFESQSVRQLAQEAQVTEKAIESRLVRVRQKLRAMVLAEMSHER